MIQFPNPCIKHRKVLFYFLRLSEGNLLQSAPRRRRWHGVPLKAGTATPRDEQNFPRWGKLLCLFEGAYPNVYPKN